MKSISHYECKKCGCDKFNINLDHVPDVWLMCRNCPKITAIKTKKLRFRKCDKR